jgi:peptidyl-prolyl cis-trans isomerase SurA
MTLFAFFLFNNADALSNIKIKVKINDKIITNFDIEKEAQYLKILNSNLNQLSNDQVLKLAKMSLINEIIKEKEILKFSRKNLEENPFLNDYLKNLYSKLNYKNQNEFENLLNQKKTYNFEEIKHKINIELYWNELIFDKFDRLVKIDEKLLLKKIKSTKNLEQREYNLLEIVFEKKKNLKPEEQFKQIKSIIKEMGFENTANVYSISQSAKFGGNLGWIKENSLSKEIVESLSQLQEGDITNVIKMGNNYLLLKINKIRINKIKVNIDEEFKKLVNSERNKQLSQFSRIFFNKLKINYSIDEI